MRFRLLSIIRLFAVDGEWPVHKGKGKRDLTPGPSPT